MVRARGSYPRSPGFESLHRYQTPHFISCRRPADIPAGDGEAAL